MNQTEHPLTTRCKKPRRFQFGLRTLLALPVAAATPISSFFWFWYIGVILFLLSSAFVLSFHPRYRRSHDVWLVRVFCIVAAVAVMFFYALFPIQERTGGPGSEATRCQGNLKAIALALYDYNTNFGCYPPAYIADETGKPLHSWRVLILPYLGKGDLYNQYNFSEPWDGSNNSRLRQQLVEFYICPTEWRQGKVPMTNCLAVVGDETLWPGSRSMTTQGIGGNYLGKVRLVEVADSGIEWLEPKDLDIGEMSFEINDWSRPSIRSQHPGGAFVCLGDGTTRFLQRCDQIHLKRH